MVFLGETVLQVSRLWPPRAVPNGRSADYRRARLADLAAARPRTEGRWPAVEGRCPIAMSVLSLSIFRVFAAVVSANEQQGRLVGEQSRRMRVLSAPGPRRRGGEKGKGERARAPLAPAALPRRPQQQPSSASTPSTSHPTPCCRALLSSAPLRSTGPSASSVPRLLCCCAEPGRSS
jgi:hypothetical protein